MSSFDADVIIVGAGPAGSIAGYTLASQGLQVIILEKACFPRYKVCGSGLTHKIIRELPYAVHEIIETTIDTIRFSHKFKHEFSRSSPEPMIYCTMRDRLDLFMVKKAEEAGAKVCFWEHVTGFRQDPDYVEVFTKLKRYKTRVLIGAEGASGTVARLAGLKEHMMQGLAWEAEVTAEQEDLERLSSTVFLDWGTFPGGYGWVFPKKDHFSIGVGGPACLSKGMIPYYNRFKNFLGQTDPFYASKSSSSVRENDNCKREGEILKIRFKETYSLKSWPMPVRLKQSRFHNNRVMISGDAAGLTDPLTGEGIYYAVRSGKMAAECSKHFLTGKYHSLDVYSDRINREIMGELIEAARINHIFQAAPLKIHQFVRDSERGWRAFGKILRGERMYADVKTGFGYWKPFWSAMANLAAGIELYKSWTYQKDLGK